jgi:spore maturation protein CgeB
MELRLYPDWESVRGEAGRHLADADVAMVTSYCPDGVAATDLVLSSPARRRVFYDLDTPVTLDQLKQGKPVFYLGPRGLGDFDLVLSYTGGTALDELRDRLGARRVAPLYGHVDPEVHRPMPPAPQYRADLSYLGTYAEDRQAALERLFIEPARRLPGLRFLIGGAQYPHQFPWTDNIYFVRHLPPEEHPAFFCSSRLTLNVTRAAMAAMGYCPSGRLFEAAACGAPLLSDCWEGLDRFFTPGEEIAVAKTTEDAIAALQLSDAELARMAAAARERTLAEHTSDRRALDLEAAVGAREANGVGV